MVANSSAWCYNEIRKSKEVRALKNKWAYWLLSLALVAGVYLVVDRTRERTVGQVCPELKEATGALAFTVKAEDDRLWQKIYEGEELDTFVDHLSKVTCRSEGTAAGNTYYEGQLYQVYLSDKDGESACLKLTDQGYMEIGNRGYSFQPEELCGYLESVLEPPNLEDIVIKAQ